MFKAYLCPQSSALFQECNQVPVYKASMPTSAGPVLVCLHSCVHRALLLKGTGYDEDAWESCRHGEFLLAAQSTGSQGLRTLALVSSLTPTQPRMDISKGLPATKSHKDTRPRQRKARGSGFSAEQGMESRLWGHGRVIKDSLSATNEWL